MSARIAAHLISQTNTTTSSTPVTPPVDPTLVGIPYLNKDALELLSNCCTSKESDLWHSLGANWTQTIDLSLLKTTRLPSSFQPIFSDGWAPVISELELIGLPSPLVAGAASPSLAHEQQQQHRRARPLAAQQVEPIMGGAGSSRGHHYRDPSEGRRLSAAGPDAARKRASPQPEALDALSPLDGSLTVPVEPELLAYHEYQQPPMARPSGARTRSAHTRRAALTKHADFHSPYAAAGHYHSQAMLSAANSHLDDPCTFHSSDGYTELQDQPLMGPRPAGGKRQPQGQAMMMRHYRSSEHVAAPSSPHGRHQQQQAMMMMMMPAHRQHRHGRTAPAGAAKHNLARNHLAQAQYGVADPAQYALETTQVAAYQEPQTSGAFDAEREAMLLDLGPAQTEWFYELQARDALIVRVLFTREANNDKELSVRRGELLEVLDDSRKWWKARNIDLQVAHVPHTIVAIMDHYRTLDELLTNSSAGDMLMAPAPHSDESTSAGHPFYYHQHHNGRSKASRRAEPMVGGDPRSMMMMMTTADTPVGQLDTRRAAAAAAGAFRYF